MNTNIWKQTESSSFYVGKNKEIIGFRLLFAYRKDKQHIKYWKKEYFTVKTCKNDCYSIYIWVTFYAFCKGCYTLDFFTYNIAIKRYCNKNNFFHPILFFLCVLKIFIFGQLCFLKPSLKIFKMSLQYFEEKNIFLSKCLFIFLSQ